MFLLRQLEAALVYDGVQLLAKALHEMDRSQEVMPKSLSCDAADSWSQGINLVNFMRNVSAFIYFLINVYQHVIITNRSRLTV